MQYKNTLITTTIATAALAAYAPSEPWSTLTPSATYKGGLTDYASTFGIAVQPITGASASASSKAKRDVISQITDGQIQATTSTKEAVSTKAKSTAQAAVSQVTDGQIQATTKTTTPVSSAKTKSTAQAAISQITDGQIQATTQTTTASTKTKSTAQAAISQITDGQIQATTQTTTASTKTKSTAQAAISQITDGQIQATTQTTTASTKTKSTAQAAISQITDGQIQATTRTSSTAAGVSQVSDGQVQASTATATATATGASQVSDGQVQATESATTTTDSSDPVDAVSCKADGTLEIVLKNGIITDENGRIGSIVANRQFQFDGPPPQAGAIYAAGWSITPEGNLALGDKDVFYQCLSGNFYNLYDETLGEQCTQVHLEVVNLISC